jgi:hypothetical protein
MDTELDGGISDFRFRTCKFFEIYIKDVTGFANRSVYAYPSFRFELFARAGPGKRSHIAERKLKQEQCHIVVWNILVQMEQSQNFIWNT